MKCVVNWIPLRIRVLLSDTQPHLKGNIENVEDVALKGNNKNVDVSPKGMFPLMFPLLSLS